MAARVGRVLGVYRVKQQIDLDVFVEGRERAVAVTALVAGYALEIAAIAGAVILARRRGPPLVPLLVVPAVVLLTVAVTYATSRFRASAETALAVLAAVAADALWEKLSARRVAGRSH
jgi:ABC-type transport system involved in cytochrome c biogenesis permease component